MVRRSAAPPPPRRNPAQPPGNSVVAATFAKALALHRQGHLAKAKPLYEQVLKLQPKHVDALHLSGLIALHAGDPRRAAALIEQAIALNPRAAVFHGNLGLTNRALGSPTAALASFDRALALDAGNAETHYHRANVLADLARLDEAVAGYDRAIALRANLAEAHANRGSVLNDLGRWREALASFDQALALNPRLAPAWSNQSNAYRALKHFDEALGSADAAIKLAPDYPEAHFTRGNALLEMQRLDEAVASYQRALALRPDRAKVHANLGHAQQLLGRIDDALASFDRALALQPSLADAYSFRALALKQRHRFEEALASYDQAIALRPGFSDAYWNKAIIHLLTGDFRTGWELYEYRWRSETLALPRREFAQALWLGKESIAGKTILLHHEQGLGDTIQFCRFAQPVADLGARVLLEVPASLRGLTQGLAGASAVFAAGDALPGFDYHCPLLSLPLALGIEPATIPATAAYLQSQPSARAKWARILGPGRKPRIGLVWSGNAAHGNDRNRSLPLRSLLEYLPETADYEYISLQKDVRDADRLVLEAHPEVRDFDTDLVDFSDTAALCEQMDLVISVDTSVAHLAAAMGKPTWILLPYLPDFRWLLGRNDSPWYPSVRLYRQDAACEWRPVLERLAADLASAF